VRVTAGGRDFINEQIMFSTTVIVDHNCSILILQGDDETFVINIWSPFLIDADNTASLITILERPRFVWGELNVDLSHDRSMIALYDHKEEDRISAGNNLLIYSIDNDTKSVTLIHSISVMHYNEQSIRFTPDDKYLCYVDSFRLKFLDLTTGRETTEKMKTTYNKIDKIGPVCFSPAGTGQHLLVKEKGGYCIASY
jgi:DNA-binding beta-propeller fold protein YncE